MVVEGKAWQSSPPSAETNRNSVSIFWIKSALAVALISIVAVLLYPRFAKEDPSFKEVSSVVEYSQVPSPAPTTEFIPVKLDFFNHHDSPLDIFWANHENEEIKMGTIEPGTSQQFNSFIGHVWIWRTSSSQEYVKSFVVENDKITEVYSKFQTTFHEDYMKEHGFNWINIYPRNPMVKWVADPVEIGHEVERIVSPAHYTVDGGIPADDTTVAIKLKTLATIPRVFLLDNFLSADECDSIINDAKSSGEMQRSGVKTTGEYIAARTSTNMWMGAERSKIVENIFRRGFHFMNVTFDIKFWKKHSESLQVLLYQEAQEYQPHDDYFKPADYPTYKAVQEGKNRYATLFLYLSDVDEGGETVFPRVGNRFVEDACSNPEGFRVPPKKGRAALFFTMLPDGNLDHNALHGGCPVIKGEKWAANFWFWDPVSADE